MRIEEGGHIVSVAKARKEEDEIPKKKIFLQE
jgi:hypothetical protein